MVNFEFDKLDTTPPTLTLTLVAKTNTNATYKIMASDTERELSNSNKYQYYLSKNSNIPENCTWINYTNIANFTVSSATSGTYYLFVYAISDKAGNISDGKTRSNEYICKTSAVFYVISKYTYTGSSTLIDDCNGIWRIKFLTSDTLTLNDPTMIDIFMIGGGGGGGTSGGQFAGGSGIVIIRNAR